MNIFSRLFLILSCMTASLFCCHKGGKGPSHTIMGTHLQAQGSRARPTPSQRKIKEAEARRNTAEAQRQRAKERAWQADEKVAILMQQLSVQSMAHAERERLLRELEETRNAHRTATGESQRMREQIAEAEGEVGMLQWIIADFQAERDQSQQQDSDDFRSLCARASRLLASREENFQRLREDFREQQRAQREEQIYRPDFY